tara:strand:+ start:51 stop:395 length:345 start_codon:yes stop_codon:yes gene_type:complete
MVGFLAPLYTLTINELRRRGTKAALKEIAKRTAKSTAKTLKKEGLKTSKFIKRRNPFEVPKIDLNKLRTAHPSRNKGIVAGTTLGAATGYVAGGSDAEKKKKKKKIKRSMTWNK